MCSCYVHERRRARALNALSPIPPEPGQSERRARHLGMLQELAELAMALARAAAQRALEQCNKPPDATPAQAAAGRAAGPRPDPNLVFERIARAVRQTIALEARIAAGDLGPASHRRPQRTPDDPRMQAIRGVLHTAAKAAADGAARRALCREIDERLDDLPAIDPDDDLTVEALIEDICDELGLTVDPATLSDEVLDILVGGAARRAAQETDSRPNPPPPLRPSGPDPP